MYGYVGHSADLQDNDVEDIDWREDDDIPFQGESPVLTPGDFVSVHLTREELNRIDPDNEYHQPGDIAVLAGYVPKGGDAMSGMFDAAIENEMIDNFMAFEDIPKDIQRRLK